MAERQTSEASDSPTRERHVRELAELQEIIRRQGEQIEKLAQELRQGRNAEAVLPPPPLPLHQMVENNAHLLLRVAVTLKSCFQAQTSQE